MQLDIFEHSRDVILRNTVIDAVKRRDADACEAAIAALATEYPADALLPDMAELRHRLRAAPLRAGLLAAEAASVLREAEERVEPAARRVLGTGAEIWLAPFWCELAQAIAGFPFDSRVETLHAAPFFMRGGDWRAALASVETIASWRRQPAPLAWMIEARFHVDGIDVAWPLIAELAWMAPHRAMPLLQRLDDARLARLLRTFSTEFEDSDAPDGFMWFPAWGMIEDADLADRLKLAEKGSGTLAECCARLVMTLLALERQGRHAELVENRRRLRDINGGLFALYMQRR